jgi:PAS domain S-box-containing protein
MSKLEYIGATTTATLWFFFALAYSGYGNVYRKNRLPLVLIVSAIFLLLAWTNELHGLIWTSFEQVDYNGMKILIVGHGFAYWALVAYSYTMTLAGSIIFVRQAIRSRRTYGAQSLAILLAVIITWSGSILYNTGLSPFPNLDLTPFSMAAAGLVCIASLLRIGPLDLFPVVSETVLESMSDGVLVLDGESNVIYANHVFRTLAGLSTDAPAGKSFDDIFKGWPGFVQTYRSVTDTRTNIEVPINEASPLYFDMRISTVQSRKKQSIGRIFVFHDVTERKQAELQLASEASRNIAQRQESTVPVVLVFRFKDGKVIEVNRSFILNLGYTREETIGRTLLELGIWKPEQRAIFMRQLVSSNQVENYPLELHRKDGKPQEYMLTASRVEIKKELYVTWLAFEKK